MINKDDLKAALEFARDNKLKSIEVNGVKFDVPETIVDEPVDSKDLPPSETPYDNLSDEEVLFWATPYYDELEQMREAHKQKLEDEKNGRDDLA